MFVKKTHPPVQNPDKPGRPRTNKAQGTSFAYKTQEPADCVKIALSAAALKPDLFFLDADISTTAE